ncbi:hypothetical protein B0J14DRAFT_608683 [Halenospora varia]|nr:hypothetical protein B0J14DRAFT_608683 [Halenospora varia]
MKHLLHFPLFGGTILLHIFSGLILTQVTEAAIDPENLSLYIDESCRDPPLPPALVGPVKKVITVAVDEMEFLIDAALQNGFNWNPNDVEGGRAGRTFNAFFGQLPGTPSVTDDSNTKDIKDNYQDLVKAMQSPKKYGIYCDSTAFDWVTTWPADTPAHFGPANQPIDPLLHPGGGAWCQYMFHIVERNANRVDRHESRTTGTERSFSDCRVWKRKGRR